MTTTYTISRIANRGFTLIEMVTSLAILSVLLVACGSIVAMASRATGDGSIRNNAQQQSADAASQIADDLNVALNFSQRTSASTTFTVPDRLNTGSPQIISYSWDGISGDPLLRQFNGGAATAVMYGVQQFGLVFNPRLMGPAAGPSEQVLFSHDAALLGSFKDNKLDNKNWGSQYFQPALPLGTSSYTLTHIRLVLKCGKQSDAMTVSLVQPDTQFRPTGTVIAQTTVYQSGLSNSYEWIDIPFGGLSNLNPLQPLCIVMTSAGSSNDIGNAQVENGLLNIVSGAYWSSSTNSGSTWSSGIGTTVARCYVFGTVP